MQQTIRARHGLLIFLLVFLSIAGGIGATVLFANQGRNLARVTRAIGVDTRDFAAPAPESVKAAKGRRIGDNAAVIPAHMFLSPDSKSDCFLSNIRACRGSGPVRSAPQERLRSDEVGGQCPFTIDTGVLLQSFDRQSRRQGQSLEFLPVGARLFSRWHRFGSGEDRRE